MAADAFLGPRTKIVTALPTFDVLGRFAEQRDAAVVAVPLTDQHAHNLERMLTSVDAATRLVYICNPNNPTGTLTRRQDLEAFLQKLPQGTYVVIDEAYHHYVEPSAEYASFIDRADRRPADYRHAQLLEALRTCRRSRWIRRGQLRRPHACCRRVGCRTASMRLPPERRVAAVDDVEHVQLTVQRNANERQEFFNQANARMLRVVDSQANFVMLNTLAMHHTTTRPAAEIVEHFKTNRALVAGPFPGYETCIRVALGTTAEIGEFWRVWDLLPGHHHMSMK